MTKNQNKILFPLLWGSLVSLVFCSGYFFSYAYRSTWQSHFPELANRWANNGPFTLLGLYGTELQFEELAYACKTQEAARHWLPYDPFIKENHSPRILAMDYLAYRVMGFVQWATDNIVLTWLILRLLCCLLWFRLVYAIEIKLGAPDGAAVFGGVFVTGFSYTLTFIFAHYLILSGQPVTSLLFHDLWAMLSAGRTESVYRLSRPGLTYCFLYLATLLLAKTAQCKHLRWGIASGVLGGLLAYVHIDVWLGYLPAAFVLTGISLWKGLSTKNLAISTVISVLVSLPLIFINYPPQQELLIRSAVAFTHRPSWCSLVYVAFFAATVYAGKREPMTLCAAAIMAGVGIAISSQVITGYDIQFGHLNYYANIYLFLVALAFISRRFKISRFAWHSAACVCLVVVLLQSMSYAAIHYPFQGLRRDDAQALSWLKANAPPDSVVLSLSPEANLLIPAFTRSKVGFGYTVPLYSDYPLLEVARRIRSATNWLGADEAKFYADLTSPIIGDRRLSDMRQEPEQIMLKTVYFYLIPIGQIEKYWSAAGDAAARTPYEVDYVWVGYIDRQYLRKDFPAGSKLHLIPVFHNDSVTIYRNETPHPSP